MSALLGLLRRRDSEHLASVLDGLRRSPPGISGDSWRTAHAKGFAVGVAHSPGISPRASECCFDDSDDELQVAGIVRLDNLLDLGRELAITLPSDPPSAAACVLGSGWKRWDTALADHLLGAFAFVLWDSRRRVLYAARDQFGIRPLCWTQTPDWTAVASSVGPLLTVPGCDSRLNAERMAEYVTRRLEDVESTFHVGVRRLPPAHWMLASQEGVTTRCYWRLQPVPLQIPDDEDAYASTFRNLFTRAVQDRLHPEDLIGIPLSGGLDSSSIACVASGLLTGSSASRLSTYSAVFPSLYDVDPRIEERSYIDHVLARAPFDAHDVHADTLSPLNPMLWEGDEPIPAPNLYMDCALFEAAHDNGSQVLLSGNDGDSTVSYGFEYLHYLARTLRWISLLRVSRQIAPKYGLRSRQVFWKYGMKAAAPEGVKAAWRAFKWNPAEWKRGKAIAPGFMREVVSARIRELDAQEGWSWNPRVQHALDVTSGLLVYLLEILDRVARKHGVVMRYPFFDRRLVEFCVSAPAQQKILDGWPRSLLRRAMKGILPDEIQRRRTKGNLSISFYTRLFARERDVLEDVCIKDPSVIEPYADLDALREMYERYAQDPAHGGENALTVFWWTVLGLWLRRTGLSC